MVVKVHGAGSISSMPSRSYYLHQAQVCQSIANATLNPILRDQYTTLALEFLTKAGEATEHDESDFLNHFGSMEAVRPVNGGPGVS